MSVANAIGIKNQEALEHQVESLEYLVSKQQQTISAQQQTLQEQRQTIASQEQTIEALEIRLQQLQARIEQLEEELRACQKLSRKPKLRASRLNQRQSQSQGDGKRAGSAKRSKKRGFQVDEELVIQPERIPAGAKFNGYRDYDVQELELKRHNIRFRLAEYVTVDGKTIVGQLPAKYRHGHFGPVLLSYVVHQYHGCRVSQPLIYEELQGLGIDISIGQIHNIVSERTTEFHAEQQGVLKVGLECSSYVHTDDTGARHQGKNGYCTVVGNDWFTYFRSTDSKSRECLLETLQGEHRLYVLNDVAQSYLAAHQLAAKHWEKLQFSRESLATDRQQWLRYLSGIGIVTAQAMRVVTEAALLGGLIEQGVSDQLKILSDGAGQFNVLVHGLCWIHAERGLKRLQGNTQQQRQNIEHMQQLLWDYYQQLKAYQDNPTAEGKVQMEQRFDQVFGRCYLHHASLNSVLASFRKHKAELLRVLDDPHFPLHNNAAESDIREQVIRRHISGSTHSEAGRRARDALTGAKKTCRKLGISFWNFLLSRFRADGIIPPLPDLIRAMRFGLRQVAIPI